jgi:hypothetical protein
MLGVEVADRLGHLLWLGGMSGVGKTTAARAIARRYDVHLYSMDSRTYEHEAALPAEPLTLDEIWVDSTQEALADWFEAIARARFPLVVDDLLKLEDGAPIIVDGPQLLAELVGPLLRLPGQALYVLARAQLQRRLLVERGSLTYSQTRDPPRARENRLRRDEMLVNDVADAAEREIDLACECHVPGCTEFVRIGLADAEAVREAALRLLSPGHC